MDYKIPEDKEELIKYLQTLPFQEQREFIHLNPDIRNLLTPVERMRVMFGNRKKRPENWQETQRKATETRKYNKEKGDPGYVYILRHISKGEYLYEFIIPTYTIEHYIQTFESKVPGLIFEIFRQIWTGNRKELKKTLDKKFKTRERRGNSIRLRDKDILYLANLQGEQPPEIAQITPVELSQKPRLKTPNGFVYLIHDRTANSYKIGLSKNPKSRLSSMQTGTTNELVLLHTIETTDMEALERELHQRFTAKALRGEWFALDTEDVEYIRSL